MRDEEAWEDESRKSSIARAVIYRLLSHCFSYPDRELLGLFDRARTEEYLESWRCLVLDASEEMASILGWLENCPSYEAALEELEREYTRLFVNAYPGVVAPPYSSVYLDADQKVWGPSTAEAVRLYEAAGLRIANDFHEVPDHIAAELEFASYLIEEQQKDRGEDSSRPRQGLASLEKGFLANHLLAWATAFFGRVAEGSTAIFYRIMAHLARQFLEREAKQFS